MVRKYLVICAALISSCWIANNCAVAKSDATPKSKMEFIRVSKDGRHFVTADSNSRFVVWGVNYDHDGDGRLLEDYWDQEWPTVVDDFNEIKSLGANVVRIHLQVGKFMKTPTEPNQHSLNQLARLLKMSEEKGLYLDITGLACYHKEGVPKWFDALSEADRWDVQARFWQAVSKTCVNSPAVFCYDIMNEPCIGGDANDGGWLTGKLGNSYFGQRITLNPAGRAEKDIIKAWIDKQVFAIRKYDSRHMTTLGDVPWGIIFKGAKPQFFTKEASQNLDFVSAHFYPNSGKVDDALEVLADYNIGKPIVIEEMFPLSCGQEDLEAFIDGSRPICDGWISFYWGKKMDEYEGYWGSIMKSWLRYFVSQGPEILNQHELSK